MISETKTGGRFVDIFDPYPHPRLKKVGFRWGGGVWEGVRTKNSLRNVFFGENIDFTRGSIFALRAHCALLLDYVPPKEPPSKPLGNALGIR